MLTRRDFGKAVAAAAIAQPLVMATAAASAEQTADDFNILGADCYSYPGDDAVKFLKDQHDIKYLGLYLTHAPGKLDKTWPRKRDFIAKSRLGFLPTYLGSQQEEPYPPKGANHGTEAVSLMKAAGFAEGTIVYLDIETPKIAGGLFQRYAQTWAKTVLDGGFYPGIYGSYVMVPWLKEITKAIWTVELPYGKKQLPSVVGMVGASGSDALKDVYSHSMLAYDPDKHPHGILRPGCVATQYRWLVQVRNVPLSRHIKNEFDLNSSRVADPSDPSLVAKSLGLASLA